MHSTGIQDGEHAEMRCEDFVPELSRFELKAVDDATIVHNLDNQTVCQLNPVATAVFNGLRNRENSPVSISDLLEDIKKQFDVREIPDDVLIADIRRTLDSFEENGLLRPSSGNK